MASNDNTDVVERNFAAFQDLLPNIIEQHKGQFALLRDANVVDYYDTYSDALHAGRRRYDDQAFSIQLVADPGEPQDGLAYAGKFIQL